MESTASSSNTNMDVFKTIAELIASSEFQDATFQYMEANKAPFTDDDENKLEYTAIFENYVQILESVIDSKLYATYSSDVVNAFYTDFKDNFKTYEGENSEAVDTLFGFTDFNRFKKQMLDFKSGMFDAKKDDLKSVDYSKKDESYFFKVMEENVDDKKLKWNKKLNHKDKEMELQIWQRPSEDGDHMLKMDLTLAGVSMETFKTFFQDLDTNMGGNSKMMKEVTVLERDSKNMPAAVKMVMKVPLMNERENVVRVVFQERDDGKYFILIHSTDRPDCPRSDKRIRIDMFKGVLFWPVENGIRSIQLQQMNMKGYFPMRLMNMAMSNAAKKQIKEVMVPKLKKIEAGQA